jgi:hypothetical protein
MRRVLYLFQEKVRVEAPNACQGGRETGKQTPRTSVVQDEITRGVNVTNDEIDIDEALPNITESDEVASDFAHEETENQQMKIGRRRFWLFPPCAEVSEIETERQHQQGCFPSFDFFVEQKRLFSNELKIVAARTKVFRSPWPRCAAC